jgi:hypothetical protein
MCWGKLSRHPGRAHAWPLCGPWPRPHLAASKLVELRSSVNLVAMPYQPLDRPVASLTNPGLRDVRYAHIAPPLAVLGSPPTEADRCDRHWLRSQGSLSQWHECCWCPYTTSRTGSDGKARSASGTNAAGVRTRRVALAPMARLAQESGTKKLPRGDHRPHVSVSWGDHFLMLTTKNPIRCQIPPQQGAAVGVVLSFGADLIPILNLDAARAFLRSSGDSLQNPFSRIRQAI